ncbi:MAG: winged helix-turn-helix domain-containing protein, partial [Psychrosphaera sp.]|nr:winged helix-turn-helix domain-containing protein [Psychrosphaera sp.]
MPQLSQQPFRIAQWVVYPKKSLISNNPQDVDLSPTMMSLLLYLVENCDRVVSREELLTEVWQGNIVSDESISRAIAHLRKSLGDSAKNPCFIKTISKQGYQFLVEPDFAAASLNAKDQQNKHSPFLIGALIALLIVVIALASYAVVSTKSNDANQARQLFKKPLTDTLQMYTKPQFSEDGRYVISAKQGRIDKKHSALIIHDLTTNTMRILFESTTQIYMSPSFSPDGKKIAYHQSSRDPQSEQKCQLTIYAFIANKSNKIAPCDAIAYKPISWSKDGKSVFATRFIKSKMQSGLVKVDIQSGEVEHLLFPQTNNTLYASGQISPSGEQVLLTAYDMATTNENIATYHLVTKQINWLAKAHNRVQHAVWGKDDDTIYFADTPKISAGIWRLSINSGEQQFIYNQRIWDFDFDLNNGRFVISIEQSDSNIWLTEQALDGQVNTKPLIERKSKELSPAISHDGKRLAFISDKGGDYNLWIRELASGQQMQLTHINKATFKYLYWSEDDNKISTVKVSDGNNQLLVLGTHIADQQITSLANVTYANWHHGSQVMNLIFKDPEKTGAYHWTLSNDKQTRLFDTDIFKVGSLSDQQLLVQKKAYGPLYTVPLQSLPGAVWQPFIPDKVIPHWQIDQQQLSIFLID